MAGETSTPAPRASAAQHAQATGTASRSGLDGGEDLCFFALAPSFASSEAHPTLHIAVAGRDPQVVFAGFRHHPASQMVLLHTRADAPRARQVREAFRDAGIPARLHLTDDAPYWGVLQALSDIVHESRLSFAEIFLNVSSGTPEAGCAATTAACLHGLRAFHVAGDEADILPVLPVSQRTVLSDADVMILRALEHASHTPSALARATGLRAADVRARVEGEPECKGLQGLGLVETGERFGIRRRVRLSRVGEALLASGLITSTPPTV